jgi:hypothetical protein
VNVTSAGYMTRIWLIFRIYIPFIVLKFILQPARNNALNIHYIILFYLLYF